MLSKVFGKNLKFSGENRKGGGGSGRRTAGAPLWPCHHLRAQKLDQGHHQVHHSQAMADRRKPSGFLDSLRRANRDDVPT